MPVNSAHYSTGNVRLPQETTLQFADGVELELDRSEQRRMQNLVTRQNYMRIATFSLLLVCASILTRRTASVFGDDATQPTTQPTTEPSDRAVKIKLHQKISVHVDEKAMSAKGIALKDIQNALHAYMENADRGDISDLENLEIHGASGATARLGDVAKVHFGPSTVQPTSSPSNPNSPNVPSTPAKSK
jgi:hypothetical protein